MTWRITCSSLADEYIKQGMVSRRGFVFSTSETIAYRNVFIQVIKYASPNSAGAECIDPDCSWVEHWYDLMQHIGYFSFFQGTDLPFYAKV